MKLKTAIEYMDVRHSALADELLDTDIPSIETDSRKVSLGQLFFAFSEPEFENSNLLGEFQDAHQFIPAAFENGAVAAVTRYDRFLEHKELLAPFAKKLIFADDVIAAFQKLANRIFLDWGKPVVAVTGSAGKTTAKELMAHLLEFSGRNVLRNTANLNNAVGHPMTVLRLVQDPSFDIAVLEMGMSTPKNEIARLCKITPPYIGVVLNVLPVHIEHLGSIEYVAKAKAELVEGLATGGTAILNADDKRVADMAGLHAGKVITYGIDAKADVMASKIKMEKFGQTDFVLLGYGEAAKVSMGLSGKHNVLNSLAAAAVGFECGMSTGEISTALSDARAPNQRGQILEFAEGFIVINDSYNSNPDALLRMVKTLVDGASTKQRKIAVVGEMLELGKREKEIHRETGEKLAASGIDFLIGVRGLAKDLVESAMDAGLKEAVFFDDSFKAGEFLAERILENDLVLVKGSRGVKTEKVIEVLQTRFHLAELPE